MPATNSTVLDQSKNTLRSSIRAPKKIRTKGRKVTWSADNDNDRQTTSTIRLNKGDEGKTILEHDQAEGTSWKSFFQSRIDDASAD